MEIERKFLIKKEQLPKDLANCSFHKIEQGYLCTDPVVRIRRQDDEYYLTYKSKGLLSREEYKSRRHRHLQDPLSDPGKGWPDDRT